MTLGCSKLSVAKSQLDNARPLVSSLFTKGKFPAEPGKNPVPVMAGMRVQLPAEKPAFFGVDRSAKKFFTTQKSVASCKEATVLF